MYYVLCLVPLFVYFIQICCQGHTLSKPRNGQCCGAKAYNPTRQVIFSKDSNLFSPVSANFAISSPSFGVILSLVPSSQALCPGHLVSGLFTENKSTDCEGRKEKAVQKYANLAISLLFFLKIAHLFSLVKSTHFV